MSQQTSGELPLVQRSFYSEQTCIPAIRIYLTLISLKAGSALPSLVGLHTYFKERMDLLFDVDCFQKGTC